LQTYRWHWPAFLTSASSGIYMFLYGTFYFFTKLHIHSTVSSLLYFGYMLLLSAAFSLLTGSVGYYSCNWFVRKIYSSIKVD
jgi:transmembrane 9 superfamily member 2/4